ncbi:MAG: GNAT family N-acetyltransferase [Saprospiraceae bacterium]
MQFEALTTNDLSRMGDLQPADWPDITPELTYYIDAPFCHPIKAKIDGKIAGIGTSIVFENTAWLAHIIVAPDFRRQGIAYQLVLELLKNLRRDGVETCLLTATKIGQPVYEKAGFRTVGEYVFLNREKPWESKPDSQSLAPFNEIYRSQVYELDKKASGENRQKLIAEYLGNAIVYLENEIVLGCYFPDLRNGLILAESVEAGLALMNVKYATEDKAVIPSANIAALAFLKQHGFAETGLTAPRMVLGKDIAWKPKMIFGRIGGNFG